MAAATETGTAAAGARDAMPLKPLGIFFYLFLFSNQLDYNYIYRTMINGHHSPSSPVAWQQRQQQQWQSHVDELSHVLHAYMPIFILFSFPFNTNAFVQVRYCFFYLDIHVYCTSTPLRSHVSRGRSHTCDPDLYHLAFTLRSFIQSRSISEVESRTHSHLVLAS